MNIFEILTGESPTANSFLMTLTPTQRNWNSFKKIILEFL
jgi:hypothetical protein